MKSTIKIENRKYIDYYLEVIVKIIGRSSTTLATRLAVGPGFDTNILTRPGYSVPTS